jgi:hypothetical protein
MNHAARNPLEEIGWFGRQGFVFVDLGLEPPAADPDQIEDRGEALDLTRSGESR